MFDKMVILQVIARMNLGGTSKYLIKLHEELGAIGIKSVIATGYVQESEIEDPDLRKVRPIRIRHLGRKISIINDTRAMYELCNVILHVQPDIVHTHTFKAGFIARVQRHRIEKKLDKKIRFIHTFHGQLFFDPQFVGIKSLIISIIERYLSKKSDRLITVGKNVKNDLELRKIVGKKKTISIPPAVTRLELISQERALKKFKVKHQERFRVLWMARVTRVKNPHMLLNIARALPYMDFYMAGGGDLLEEIRANSPKNLKVLGWQKASEVLPIADVFLSTSDNEGIPIAMIEAQLAGIPIVATDVGSVFEVVLHNKTGILCNKSEEQLIAAIKNISMNKKLRKKFSDNAKAITIKNFTINKFIKSHYEIYSKS